MQGYPHLTANDGVNTSNVAPALMARAEALAVKIGKTINITSGYRSVAEQQVLWDGAPGNGLVRGKTVAAPGGSLHQGGYALDLTVGGQTIQSVVPAATIRAVGLYPLVGDSPHVQLFPGGTSLSAAQRKTPVTITSPLSVTGGPRASTPPNGITGLSGTGKVDASTDVGAAVTEAGQAITDPTAYAAKQAASLAATAVQDGLLAAVKVMFDSVGKDGFIKLLLTTGLVIGGTGLALYGVMTALNISPRQAAAVALAPETDGASLAMAGGGGMPIPK
jgi:hypothetical protein